MIRIFRHAAFVAALALGATTLATTAEARDRYRDRGDDAALAIGAGIIGLAVGAAIASNRDRYYDGGYYGPRRGYAAYGYPRSYYPAYPRGYYYDRALRRFYRNDRGWNGGWDRGYARPRYRGW
ncbi:hypothetical protein [Novosphingobium sp. JCM 18896]|uniref:hypothetical protein n=1 Tax=Novosphingobium sp. JCM 18896 TaxID=2989731 RepID=UPI00222357B2|nr:hypothetical protein [Novosphingobium sp. JCM 18896]MCW1429923.1 hypothetical protein [Novosphingobium sp. JCM 18896]